MRRSKFSRPATYPFLSSPGTHSLRWRNPSPNRPNFNLPFPPPPPPSRSLPLDSLLQHLAKETATTLRPPSSNKNPTFPSLRLAATSPHREKLPPAQGTRLAGVKGGARFLQDPRLGFLSAAGKSLLRSLVEWPLVDFVTLLEARKDEIFGMDWVGLLKVVEILGNWEKALTLFEWDASTSRAEGSRLDVPAIEVMIKMKARDWRTYDFDYRPYFTLRHLWESFQEWSAYGAGVPLVLESGDSAVQYYVPYLSGIQLYGQAKKQGISSKLLCNLQREESDSDSYQDSSSDGTGSSLGEHFSFEEVSSSDEGDAEKSQGHLLFEYFERDSPYVREPLAEKMLNLSSRFPELSTLTSYDLLPASWISVAWYPIYRIPVGPTLKDVDACFLTYHSLSTPQRGAGAARQPIMIYPEANDLFAKISIPAFALASYKFKSSLWTSTEEREKQLTISLLQAADDWLRLLHVDHPDYKFFVSDGAYRR